MAEPPAEPPSWKPPSDECDPAETYTVAPPGAEESEERVKLRIITHTSSSMTAEFAVVHQTYRNGDWHTVTAADSCHDGEVHLHRYARSTDARVGEPEHVRQVASLEDLGDGYNEAYEQVVENWDDNKRRWQDA